MGPPGPDGPRGPEGPAGPAGEPGATFRLQHSWNALTAVGAPVNGMLPLLNLGLASPLDFTTSGGPLLIQMNVVMFAGGHSTCQPYINGQWAGAYGGLPWNNQAPLWREGVIQTAGTGNRMWTPSRVYPGVPAGTYRLDIGCATDMGTLTINNSSGMFSSVSIIELR